MKFFIIILSFILLGICNKLSICNKSNDQNQNSSGIVKLKEIWGNRLEISGDFNGDKLPDTLSEQFISSINNKETNKYYEGIEYDSIVALTIQKKPICVLVSSSGNINPLIIKSKTFQIFGLSYLKNEGDLDHNGTDEIGLVVDWADYSNINSYNVYSYIDKSWVQVLTFEIRDYDIEKDITGHYADTTFKGFLTHNNKGKLIAKTYEAGDKVEKTMKLRK
jgi:hypothetical protein